MPLIAWNESYNLSIKEMDEQHKKLFALLNDTLEAIKAHKDAKTIDGILDQLDNYTKEHFTKEEAYMQQFDYEKLPQQQQLHAFFIEKIAAFRKELDAGTDPSLAMVGFLKEWLLNHILGVDKEYVDCFKDHGL